MQHSHLSLQFSSVAVLTSKFNHGIVNVSGIVHFYIDNVACNVAWRFLALASSFHLVCLYFCHSLTVEGDYCSSVSTLKVFKIEYVLVFLSPRPPIYCCGHTILLFIFG